MINNETWTPDLPIREECWTDFRKDYSAVWDQLIYLRTSLYLLQKIAAFPLHRFAAPDDQWFFTVIRRSLYEGVILGVTKLVTDQKGDLLNIRQWRNRVLSTLRPEFEEQFRLDLKQTNLDAATEALAKRARDFRDGKVAHLRLEDVRRGTVSSLGLSDLERLVNETERLFQPLLFGAEAKFIPPHYDPDVRALNRLPETDVDRILSSFAAQSYVLNEPERNPNVWPHLRSKMTEEELHEFNEWRARVGKPAV